MATNLAINDQLLNNALEIGGFRTKKNTTDRDLRIVMIGQYKIKVTLTAPIIFGNIKHAIKW